MMTVEEAGQSLLGTRAKDWVATVWILHRENGVVVSSKFAPVVAVGYMNGHILVEESELRPALNDVERDVSDECLPWGTACV